MTRRKLKVLVISMGSKRQELIEDLFADPTMAACFDTPTFSTGIPSRTLNNRFHFLRIANEVGLLPEKEWEAIRKANEEGQFENHTTEKFFDCLKDVEVKPGRRGSDCDVKLHYSVELWRKAKSINRGRAVLACTFAHLMAMKKFVDGSFDIILEDNVRAAPSCCARRIWEAMDAVHEWETTTGKTCHYRFVGWLGSIPNLKWILQTHAPKRQHVRECGPNTTVSPDGAATIFPFPCPEHLDADLCEFEAEEGLKKDQGGDDHQEEAPSQDTKRSHTTPGGNPVWGCYAYWISPEAYQRIMDTLRNDVGSMLWKGKRMRNYVVKPIDKILPRQIMSIFEPSAVQLSSNPSFFRAPMLTSKIHTQWDPEFCKSTEYQLQSGGLGWSDLWLSKTERDVVDHRSESGEWLTVVELSMLEDGKANSSEN